MHCCFPGCSDEADWVIYHAISLDPYDPTECGHACNAHVEEMMHEAFQHYPHVAASGISPKADLDTVSEVLN